MPSASIATTPEPLRVHIKPASAAITRGTSSEPSADRPAARTTAAQPAQPRAGTSLGRALVVGVDAEYASVISEVLTRAFDTRMTTATEVALGLIASQHYEAVVLEAEAAGAIPLRVLVQHVRSRLPEASIVVTWQGPVLSQQVVECFEADADDCLAAPFHPSEFLARVTRGVRRAGRTRGAVRAGDASPGTSGTSGTSGTPGASGSSRTAVAKSRRMPETSSEVSTHERRLPRGVAEARAPKPASRVRVPALVGEA